jgi:transposase
MMPGMPERRTHDYYRHGITSLFAAFNIADGTVISELHRRHRAIEFRKFLARIDKAVPADLDVHLVCDNYATHNTPEIRTWLARHPRFHVHFTPTGSSWMNQVERWFGLLTDKLIRRGVHTSVQALENDIREWIATWNDNPRPFTWTKTADEILNSLADYLAKLGPGHAVNEQGLHIELQARHTSGILWVSGALPGSVHDKKAEWIWGVLDELEKQGLVTSRTRDTRAAWAKVPCKGKNKPEPQKEANRAHAKLRALGERANAQLKVWKILTKLRCCPWRAGKLAKAIHVLQLREA